MGSFSDISFGNYTGLESKNGYYEDIANLIFTPSDYTEITINEEGENYVEKVLQSTARICKKRLEAFGATKEKVKEDFDKAINDCHSEGFIDRIISFEEYLKLIKEVLNNYQNSYERADKLNYGTIEHMLLESDFYLENQSLSLWLYVLISSINEDSIVKYNLTQIIYGGWISNDFYKNIQNQKIIILTEGKTDSEYIKKSLHKLYPELFDFYHFMDFDLSKSGGGASLVVHSVKAFIGSGIRNLIIALFDNDTVGLKELNNLRKINLPLNIRALQYPEIELANNYPTIGPTGLQNININGLACSLEMYFGADILKNGKSFIPIQWFGYDKQMEKYQGVVQDKGLIQKRFEKKLGQCDIKEQNWTEMRTLIEMIINAWI